MYRRITLGALVAVAVIIVTGAGVRLTGSGLGCPDWPTCAKGRVVAPLQHHAMIEFLNRLFTGVVSIAVILAVLGSVMRRPRRADLVKLSSGLAIGLVAQIVWGGLVVLSGLNAFMVAGHFVISLLLVWDAVVLHHRAGQPDVAPHPVVDGTTVRLGRALVAVAGVVVLLGTVVTASGPHRGDARVKPVNISLHDAARVHGLAVTVFLTLVVVMLARLARRGGPAATFRRGEVLLGIGVAQAAIGYIQYFSGVPEVLVAIHVLGATLVWIAVLELHLGLFARDVVVEAVETPERATIPARIDGWVASNPR
jgi:cytochrome c oxidase assembly protein subunit 15